MATKFKKKKTFIAKNLHSASFRIRVVKPKRVKVVLKEEKKNNIYSLAPIC